MASELRSAIWKGIGGLLLVAAVFVGVSMVFDLLKAVISVVAFGVVVYLGWRAYRVLSR